MKIPADTCFGRDSKTVRHWCGFMLGDPENHLLFAVGFHDHPLPAVQFAVDNQSRERFLDAFEQRAAQGADAVFALVADGGKGPLRLVGDFDLVAESVGTGEQPLEFQVDDPLHVREVERAEDDDVVDAVQELRCEGFRRRCA